MKKSRTTIHIEGDTFVDYEPDHNGVFLHMGCGGFSHCLRLSSEEARLMSEALMKGAFAIEADRPEVMERAA